MRMQILPCGYSMSNAGQSFREMPKSFILVSLDGETTDFEKRSFWYSSLSVWEIVGSMISMLNSDGIRRSLSRFEGRGDYTVDFHPQHLSTEWPMPFQEPPIWNLSVFESPRCRTLTEDDDRMWPPYVFLEPHNPASAFGTRASSRTEEHIKSLLGSLRVLPED